MNKATVVSLIAFPAEDTHGGVVVRADIELKNSHGGELSFSLSAMGNELDVTVLRDSGHINTGERCIRVSFVLGIELKEPGHIDLLISEQRLFGVDTCGVSIPLSEIEQALRLQNKRMEHAQAAPHHQWMLAHQPSLDELVRQREEASLWTNEDKPLISIVTPVFNPPSHVLAAMIDSVIAQTYENWELILANASGDAPEVLELFARYTDSRIRVIPISNRSIAENTNEAILHTAGDYIAFIDHDDFIEPDALYQYVLALHDHPETDLFFCDEDLCCEKEEGEMEFYGPRFKPGWNYDLALTHNYICHLLMVSRWALERTERSGVDVSAAQDYDLTFKVAEIARGIVHIPRVLYHWRESVTSTARNRDSKPYALEAGRLAVQHHLDRKGIAATVHVGSFPFSYRIQYHLPDPAVGVTLVIYFDGRGDIAKTLSSVRSVTEYPWDRYEIIVATTPRYRRRVQSVIRNEFAKQHGTSFVSCCVDSSSNSYVGYLNSAVSGARFRTIVSLDSYCEAVEGNWLTELIEPLRRTDVAITSSLLLEGDGLVSSFGMTLGGNGELVPIGMGMQLTDFGYMSIMFHARDCDVVPRVGVAFRQDDWLEWMYDSCCRSFAYCCLRARARGMKVVVEPYGPLKNWRDIEVGPDAHLLGISESSAYGDSYLNPWLDPLSNYFALK